MTDPVAVTPDDDDNFELPPDFDFDAHHAGREPALREIFATPVIADGVRGDTLLDD
jgi:hypothetical protein